MSIAENKALVHRFIEAMDHGDVAVMDQVLDANLRFYPPGSSAPVDRAGMKQFAAMFRAAFPDYSHTIVEMVAEGDLVAGRVRWRGTHRGEFQGIPPTGKEVTITGIGTFRVTGGKIVEHWAQPDIMSLLQQIGALPSPANASR